MSLPTQVAAYPIVGLLHVGAVGSILEGDTLYGVLVTILLPNLLVWMIA